MSTLPRFAAWTALFGMLLVGGASACLCVSEAASGMENVKGLLGVMREIDAEQKRGKLLDEIDAEVMSRLRAKAVVIEDLLKGRRTLRQAAIEFRRLLRGSPRQLEMIDSQYPGRTLDERICRNVIDFARGYAHVYETSDATIAGNLERELAGWLASCEGRLFLPESE
jgi:hypothetical protein